MAGNDDYHTPEYYAREIAKVPGAAKTYRKLSSLIPASIDTPGTNLLERLGLAHKVYDKKRVGVVQSSVSHGLRRRILAELEKRL